MNDIPLWVQIVIAVVGGDTVGGLAGAFSPILSTRLTYQQKLDENFRTNVRLHIETLYIPLNIALSRLTDQLDRYWETYYVTGEKGNEEEFIQEVIEFTNQILSYLNKVWRSQKSGSSASFVLWTIFGETFL